MAEKTDVCLRFTMGMLPFVAGAKAYAEQWLFPAGSCNNQRFYGEHISFGSGVSEEMQSLLFTPETSGGLLMAVPQEEAARLTEALAGRAVDSWIVGDVVSGRGVQVMG
jgi:selenide,water dikinase